MGSNQTVLNILYHIMKKAIFYLFTSILCLAACDELTGGADELLNLKSDSEIEVGAAGTSVRILFEAQGTWSAESDSDWAVPAQEYGDEGEISLDVTVYPNETGSERTAVITIGCGDETAAVRIIQSADKGGDVPGIESQVLVESITETDEHGYQMKFSYEYDYIESFGKYMPVKEIAIIDDEVNDVVFEYREGYIDRILYFEGQEDYRYRILLDSDNRVRDISDEEYPASYTVEYDSEGRIVSEFSGDPDASYYSVKYEWANGNLVKSTRRDVSNDGSDLNGDGIFDENDVSDNTSESVYTYTEYANNTNLDLNARFCDSFNSGVMSEGPGLFGITGTRSENLGYGVLYAMSEPWHDFYTDSVTEGQVDKVTNYDLYVGNDEAEAVFEFNDDGYPVKLTVTAPLYKTEIIWTYTYEIDYNGRSEVLGGEVYYFDFERSREETTGKTFQDGHVSRIYEITYTTK